MPLKAANSRMFKAALASVVVVATVFAFSFWHRSTLPDRAAREWTTHVNRTKFDSQHKIWRVDKFSEADWQYLFRESLRPDLPRDVWLVTQWIQLPWSLKRWVPRPRDNFSRQIALRRAWESCAFHPESRRMQLLRAASEPGSYNPWSASGLATDYWVPSAAILPELLHLLAHSDIMVRKGADRALRRIDPLTDAARKDALLQLSIDSDPEVSALATSILQRPRRIEVPLDEILPPAPFDPDATKIKQPVGLW
jgi:hypothetical protein